MDEWWWLQTASNKKDQCLIAFQSGQDKQHGLWWLTAWLHLIYLLSPWSRVLPEKLTGFQLVKKFPTLYGTQRSNTRFTSAHHLSLSWASLIQSIPPHHFLMIHLNINLPSTPMPAAHSRMGTMNSDSKLWALVVPPITLTLDDRERERQSLKCLT
jgi:hypothetical protein